MSPPPPARERPLLLVTCGVVGILGIVSIVTGTIAGSFLVPDYDWVADTISDLGAGRWEIVMDVALYGYAAALIALALGAAHLHLGAVAWSLGIFSLCLLAVCVIIIGARNEYGDADTGGVVIHRYLVYALGVLFFAAPLLMAGGAAEADPAYRRIFVGCAVVWLLAAPVFYLLPTSVDGLWERLLGVITLVWLASLSTLFLRRGHRARRG